MTEIIKPVLVGLVNGRQFRMFRSPRPKADWPWHSTEDLRACMDLPRHEYRRLERMAKAFADETAEAETVDGRILIGSHSLAREMILAGVRLGHLKSEFDREYISIGTSAFNIMTAALSEIAKRRFAVAASRA